MAGCLRRPVVAGKALRPPSHDPDLGRLLVQHHEEWFAIHAGVPGAEVHRDPDITWKLESGTVWSNAAIAVRFKTETVERRLNQILPIYAASGRGCGIWVDVDAQPMNLEDHLAARGFRCRKHFPGMACDLRLLPRIPIPKGITIRNERDYSIFTRYPHPVWGSINTPIRKYQLSRSQHMTAQVPQRVFMFIASKGERPIGSCTLFIGNDVAGIHYVAVLREERGKGVGSALIAHAFRFAHEAGESHAVLLSSGMGETMYRRSNFQEVCRVGYWYAAKPR